MGHLVCSGGVKKGWPEGTDCWGQDPLGIGIGRSSAAGPVVYVVNKYLFSVHYLYGWRGDETTQYLRSVRSTGNHHELGPTGIELHCDSP